MRTLKFRAWDKRNKLIVEVSDIDFGEEQSIGIVSQHRQLFEGEYELMQFTGLHDKNGKEIWEGDILSWKNSSGTWTSSEVKFIQGAFCIVWGDGEEFLSYPLKNIMSHSSWDIGGDSEAEVLGNVHENPELLTNH